jgi:predicted nucleic-acid-binding protein
MIALDTNVLIRFLVRDDERQAGRARALIEGAAAAGDRCLVTSPVICELEWVLEGVYNASRADIAETVRDLLTTPPFVVEDDAVVRRALASYIKGKADFSDYLLGQLGRAGGARTTYTLDRALRNGEGFTVLA